MAKLILKSPYLKPAARTHSANYVRYIATRDGVIKPDDPKRQLPATQFQQQAVAQLLKDYPDAAQSLVYQAFQQSLTRADADEFILSAAEEHPELFASRNKYVSYIATRPGAVRAQESGNRSQGHGLFSDAGAQISLEKVAEEVARHSCNVWAHIISLKREDADRLGYGSVDAWIELLRRQRNTIAREMKIDPKNFRWYAAFHDAETHPHVHLMAWSAEPKEAYLTEKGIEGIKSALAREIFQQDLVQIYEQQTFSRDKLRQDGQAVAAEIVAQINAGGYDNPIAEDLLRQLAERLKPLHGKKIYGYLPADAKTTVDRIVDELAKDERITRLYDLWYTQREAVLETYRSEMPDRVPLSQNEVFKSIKNAVIAETQNLLLEQSVFPQEAAAEPEPSLPEPSESDALEPEPVDTQAKARPSREVLQLYRQAKELLDDYPQEAARLLTAAAEQGYEWAQYRLGKMLLLGQGVARDVEVGEAWLRRAIAQENSWARYVLGKALLLGDPLAQDVPAGLALLQAAAEQKNDCARYLLGKAYLAGELVPADPARAEEYFSTAAEKYANAQYALAKMHLKGIAHEPNAKYAVELLAKAADQNHEWAQYAFGKLLFKGEGIPQELPRAEQLLLQAAQSRPDFTRPGKMTQGNEWAQLLLGKLYLARVPPALAEAEKFLKQAAKQSNANALYALAKMHLDGTAQNPSANYAVGLLWKAIAQKHQWAQYQLGKLLFYGDSVEKDEETAVRLLGMSAAQGNVYAQALLERWQTSHLFGATSGALHLLEQLARLIENEVYDGPKHEMVESKLLSEINAKKREQGLKLG